MIFSTYMNTKSPGKRSAYRGFSLIILSEERIINVKTLKYHPVTFALEILLI